MKLNAKQLRSLSQSAHGNEPEARFDSTRRATSQKPRAIYIILDNVLDTYNIGSIFRLADAVNAKKIYLCGGSETPPNHRIKKASINTMEIIDWQYFEDTKDAIKDLRFKIKDLRIIAIEQNKKAVPYDKFDYKLPLALVVGNESDGVSKEVLEICDGIVELPMFGVNISLNVMVSLGIVLYKVVEKCLARPI